MMLRLFKNDRVVRADPDFFSVFTLPLLSGDAKTALSQPQSVVLSKSAAEKYFGNEDPIGKSLGFNDNTEFYKVTGVFDKIPDNSHFHADMLVSMAGWQPALSDSWMQGSFYTLPRQLKPGTSLSALEAGLPGIS